MKSRQAALAAFTFLTLSAGFCQAHAISMSTGYATVSGSQVEYLLKMPRYEMTQVKDPAKAIFSHIRFTSGFETGRPSGEECHDDPESGNYICAADYHFSHPVERLGVECTFYDVTVGNHIHMLHAERDSKSDQAILDSAFPSATLAFRPPTAIEMAFEQSGAAALRVWTNYFQLLLLAALAIASRRRTELALNGAAFLAGECLSALAILRSGWQPTSRFAEAAAALALAYLAFEIIVFPKSRGRWLLALVFGTFAGMYFASFIGQSGYAAAWVLSGAVVAGAAVLALALAAGFLIPKLQLSASRQMIAANAAAVCLFATGAVWFFVRLRS